MTLHEAVHKTSNKLLDDPEFKFLCIVGAENDLESRLVNALRPLGYVYTDLLNKKDQAFLCNTIHPLALKYFKKFGKDYVLLLEATKRLAP